MMPGWLQIFTNTLISGQGPDSLKGLLFVLGCYPFQKPLLDSEPELSSSQPEHFHKHKQTNFKTKQNQQNKCQAWEEMY